MIVSFEDYVPPARFDDEPWNQIRIDEATTKEGPWTIIDTIPMNPLDSDPTSPMARSFTTDNGTLTQGWYIVSFLDTVGNRAATLPVQNAPGMEWGCSVTDVAELVLIRTRDDSGNLLGTFNNFTRPTDEQTRALIYNKAIPDVLPLIGTDIPDELIPEAQNVVAIRTAMYIELTFFGNEVAQNRSVYNNLKTLFDEKVATLQNAVAAIEAGGEITDDMSGAAGRPFYDYPDPVPILGGQL